MILLRDVRVHDRLVDVSIEHGLIAGIGPRSSVAAGTEVIDGGGGALIAGLWDHHIHLLALAAARRSVAVGPPAVYDLEALARALSAARPHDPDGWVRAVGYHDSVAGPLDRDVLDRILPHVPVRVQDRSGSLWVMNSEAIARLGLDEAAVEGLERDRAGRLTGRAYGLDGWLRERVQRVDPRPVPELSAVGAELARYGVVGLTDATPYEGLDELELLAATTAKGDLPQRLFVTGGPGLAGAELPSGLARGPVKVRLADHALPGLDELAGWIASAHQSSRPVAVHCVTREALALVLAAFDDAGAQDGDRIEHGSVIPPDLSPALRHHNLTVVTQPGFVAERGDRYLTDVDPDDRPHLYPCRSLITEGIRVAGSTDAPFGHADPWRAMVAAIERLTAEGAPLGPDEAVAPSRALGLFLGHPTDPGGPARRVEPGQPADLCLLDAPLDLVLARPHSDRVRATIVAGQIVYRSS